MNDSEALLYPEVPAKRSDVNPVPVQFDWHDQIAIKWQRGAPFEAGVRVRPERSRCTGLEYEVTTAGVTGNRMPNFPAPIHDEDGELVDNGIGLKCRSGSVVFTSRAMTSASLRTVSASVFSADEGITLSDESNDDGVYTVHVSGGLSGNEYKIVHRLTFTGGIGEMQGQALILPVQD